MSNSTYNSGAQQSMLQGLSQLQGNGCTTATTTTIAGYPYQNGPFYTLDPPAPTMPVMNMIPGTLGFFISPVANGFLVGINTQSLDKAKFCTNYTEAAEAIVAFLALNKIMEQSNGK